jgi:DNA polymerase/3'-5' exonuclease PolX
LHFIRWNAFVYAALHETGSPAFWLGLRDGAAKLGFELTKNHLLKRTGIFKEVFGADATQYFEDTAQTREYEEDELVYLSSEEDVFRFLDMKYVPPHERNW